jgi:hypothetical protein
MKFRKFEILSAELSPGGPGPERLYRIKYRAIVNKQWVEGELSSLGRNEQEAIAKAQNRFGGKE